MEYGAPVSDHAPSTHATMRSFVCDWLHGGLTKVRFLQAANRRKVLRDVADLALVGNDDLLFALRELTDVERLLRMSQARELRLKVDDSVVDRQALRLEEEFSVGFVACPHPLQFRPPIAPVTGEWPR